MPELPLLGKVAQPVISGLILVILTGIGAGTIQMRDQMQSLTFQVAEMGRRLDDAASDRYRAGEARQDFEMRDRLRDMLEQRVTRLEQVISGHPKAR